MHSGLHAVCVSITLIILFLHLITPRCHISTGAFLLCVCPSSSSSSSSSPAYLNTPICPVRTTEGPGARQPSMLSVSILLLLLLTIISNLPQHPKLPHQHDLVHGGLPDLYVHHSLPPPPHHQHHHHLQLTSTPRVAPSARPGARRPSCCLCPSFSSSSSSSPSSQTYLNTPSCPISTAWCTAAFLLSMCPFSLHHMRCGG